MDSYNTGEFGTIHEELEEREVRSRRREARRRSTVIDGRSSKLTGALQLNLPAMMRTQGPENNEMKPDVNRRYSVIHNKG